MAKDEKGSILVFTLAVLSLLCLISTSMLVVALNDYRANAAVANRIQAYYLAEAGAAFASAYVLANGFTACPSGKVAIPFPEDLFPAGFPAPTVHLERDASGTWQVVSVGKIGVAVQVVRVNIEH